MQSVDVLSTTVLVGEGNEGSETTDARYAKNQIPPAWLSDTNSPSHRHFGEMNLLFADGRVKHSPPQRLTTSPQDGPLFVER